MVVHGSPDGLRGQLDRWVSAGLIDADQADRIEAAERAGAAADGAAGAGAARAGAAGPAPGPAAEAAVGPGEPGRHPGAAPGARAGRRALPLVVEALGYVGGVLAIVAGFVAVGMLWPDIPTEAELGFAAAGAVALGLGGAAPRTGGDPAFARLRSALWLMSAASLTAFAGVLGAQVWDLRGADTVLLAAAAGTSYSAALWVRERAVLQHLAMFAGAAVIVGVGVARIGPGLGVWAPGLAVWALAALWGGGAFAGYLPPQGVGYVAAGVGLLVGAELTMGLALGNLLALVTVAGILTAGVLLHRVELLALGAVGVLLTVPQTASRYLPTSVAAPLAIFVVGVVLLAVALWLARSRGGRLSR